MSVLAEVRRVAVLLPIRNGADTLPAALASLQAQTFRDFRVVAVDDGSEDATHEILEETARAWRARDPDKPELTVHRLRPGRGIGGALQYAAIAATTRGPFGPGDDLRLADSSSAAVDTRLTAVGGTMTRYLAAASSTGASARICVPEFLARQDADDVSRPERFERQVAYLDANPDVDVAGTRVRTVADAASDGWRRYERWLDACVTPEEIARNLWVESPLPHPSVMMRREAYERVGGYRAVPWPEDYDLWLRMLRAGIRMAKLPEVLYDWTDRSDRASRTLAAYSPEAFLACRAHHLVRHLGDRSIIVWGAGRDGRRTARALLREGADLEGFLDIDPRKVGRTAYGRPIHDAETWLGANAPPTRGGPIVLAAVGTEGARELIRERLQRAGFEEGPDFLCVA